ncbi:MAG: hypothetical protein NZ602_04605 [Thermoguttaceae bacterium]|nr:hypothetical protein [Thermoguttaceae bacterium]MDW8036901.1 hypothetical protein [Thermoguttaceae bacterium]
MVLDLKTLSLPMQKHLQEVVGYLNFSSGSRDPKFFRSLNELFAWLDSIPEEQIGGRTTSTPRSSAKSSEGLSAAQPTWRRLGQTLQEMIQQVSVEWEAFEDVEQAAAVSGLVFQELLPAYRRWHEDLLFHQPDEVLFQPFFIARACEAVLAAGPPWDQTDRIVRGALNQLNDFIGYRPVAVLRTGQQMQPYAHEWVCPIPLYVAGAGVGYGKYQKLIEKALEILQQTDPAILEEAGFELELLDELGMDPRAYDFDHPVNRRPNYQFGTWDLHHLDQEGRYRRYVVQHTTLEAIWSRLKEAKPSQQEEYLWEAAAVLAGTILMGSGMTGSRPSSHDSSMNLMKLLPQIAGYRDRFYQDWLQRLTGKHGERLRREAHRLKQPFAGARQHLNQQLARQRALQMQHVGVAQILASLGDFDGARAQIQAIPGLGARMKCELHCQLTAALVALRQGQLQQTLPILEQLENLLHRAIQCGALIDPWNILGFSAQFPLFAAVENSIHDYRADELIGLMSRLFDLGDRVAKEAAATGRDDLRQAALDWLARLADWWDQFATTEVSDVRSFSGREAHRSAQLVSEALRAWYAAGTAAGKVAFWRDRLGQFRTAKAYALLVDTLLERKDLVAAMALLVHWLSQADQIPLQEGPYSFHLLALSWMYQLWHQEAMSLEEQWKLARKFLDYLEANAGALAEPYCWQLSRANGRRHTPDQPDAWDEPEPWEAEAEDLFAAAYEGVTYRDSAQDGVEGSMMEWSAAETDFELATEGEQMIRHVAFWNTMAWLWKYTACASLQVEGPEKQEVLAGWLQRLRQFQTHLQQLLRDVFAYEIAPPRASWDSLTEYERRREIKDNLLERLLTAAVELAEAQWFLLAASDLPVPEELSEWEKAAVDLLRAAFRQQTDRLSSYWNSLALTLMGEPVLYIPVSRGGHPARILRSQKILSLLRKLAKLLPHLGQIDLCLELISLVPELESRHPAGPGAVTEFDRLFLSAVEAIIQCLIHSANSWLEEDKQSKELDKAIRLFEMIQKIGRPLMNRWLQHSRAIQLSPAESLNDPKLFRQIRQFIEQFGAEWFTQEFMTYGNLRAILLQGVDRYLEALQESEENGRLRLLESFRTPEQRQQAIRYLEIILETILEHYSQYIDYNSTTTQSDRGQMLYSLLDFIRLLAVHQRFEWSLRPVWTVHEVLVEQGLWEVATQWQETVQEQTTPIAKEHLQLFEELCQTYGMRLATVGDRLAEKFQGPFLVNRLKTLLRLAWQDVQAGKPSENLQQLKSELTKLANQPWGVGWEPPDWLQTLYDELQSLQTPHRQELETFEMPLPMPPVPLSYEQLQRQLRHWL